MNAETRKKKSRPKLFLFCFWAVIFFAFAGIQYFEYRQFLKYKVQADELTEQLKLEDERNSYLVKQMNYTATDEYIEEMARKWLGLVKPDEYIFINTNK